MDCEAYPEIDGSFVCSKCNWRAFEDKGKPCQVAEPECEHCRDTGWRRFGFGSMDLEPCGCKADLGAAP